MTEPQDRESFDTIGFLNQVMSNYPQAISFAPGAPVLDGVDRQTVMAALDAFVSGAGAHSWAEMLSYGPSQGIIRSELSGVLATTQGLNVSESDIAVTVGAQEAFLLVLRALDLQAAGTLAIVTPAFGGIRGAAHFLGASVLEVNEGPDGVDVDTFERACADQRVAGSPLRALYVAPDFSNPSGTIMPLTCRRQLLDAAAHNKVLVIEDTTYGFTDSAVPPTLKALDKHGIVIQIGTFSKVCAPGLRVGFVIADQAWRDGTLAQRVASLKNMTTVNTPGLSQAVVAGMVLSSPTALVRRHHERAEIYALKRELLLAALDDEFGSASAPGIRWNRPTGGFFVTLKTTVNLDHGALRQCAVEHGVLWTPMRDFYDGHEGDQAMLLSYSFVPTGQIREGVARLRRFLRGRGALRGDSEGLST